VSWLLEGEILHRDSVGSVQLVRPGELNLMTSGRAISHSEESPTERSARLHGVQLWVALPDQHRHVDPWFSHHADLPVVEVGDATVRVVMGEYAGATSKAVTYTPIVAAQVAIAAEQDIVLALDVSFEHGVLALSDGLTVDGTPVPRGSMIVFDAGRAEVRVTGPGQALLIGGTPFEEELVMWWNFVGRSHDEIVQARAGWEAGRGFGEVHGYAGDRLAAPPMPGTRLRPRPRTRFT
jgi:hypothetical protein